MKSVSPIFPNSTFVEVTYAKDQPEYEPLTVVRTEKLCVSRWRLTDEEREFIANGGDLYILVAHFGKPLQPILPMITYPTEVMDVLVTQS